MTFIVDNLGTVSRARAILADVQKKPLDVLSLLRAAEWFETLDENQGAEDDTPPCPTTTRWRTPRTTGAREL